MIVARIRIGRSARPNDPDVREAVQEVWAQQGNRNSFDLTIDSDGIWSHYSFNVILNTEYPEPRHYHPNGRSGKLAEFVARETAGQLKWLVERAEVPGRVY